MAFLAALTRLYVHFDHTSLWPRYYKVSCQSRGHVCVHQCARGHDRGGQSGRSCSCLIISALTLIMHCTINAVLQLGDDEYFTSWKICQLWIINDQESRISKMQKISRQSSIPSSPLKRLKKQSFLNLLTSLCIYMLNMNMNGSQFGSYSFIVQELF